MADSSTPKKTGELRCRYSGGGPNSTWLSSSSWDLDDRPNCEPHSDGKSSSRRTSNTGAPRPKPAPTAFLESKKGLHPAIHAAPGGPACSNRVALDLAVPQMSQDL